jgi:hypothetical protein
LLCAVATLADGSECVKALSGGILIYVALAHMIRAYHEAHAESKTLQWHRYSIDHALHDMHRLSGLIIAFLIMQAGLLCGPTLWRSRDVRDWHLGLRVVAPHVC